MVLMMVKRATGAMLAQKGQYAPDAKAVTIAANAMMEFETNRKRV